MAMNYRKKVYVRDEESIRNDIENITDLYGGAEKRLKENADGVKSISIEKLQESKLNHFKAISGDEWDEFVASIKSHGILTPITLRPIDEDSYEILAGHNRVRGAKEAGLIEVPSIIKNVDDVEASIIVADTNLQREEVTDLEKGWAYRNIFEAISRQGERSDLTSSQDGTKLVDGNFDTSSQKGTKLRSDEIIAKKYGIGRNTVNRKIRLTYLIYPLYTCYEEKLITQDIAEQLSYLRSNEQALIEGLLHEGMEIDTDIAKAIRSESEKRKIDDKDMKTIANSNVKYQEPKARIKRYRVDDSLFPKNIKKGLREEYIIKALTYIKLNGIDL